MLTGKKRSLAIPAVFFMAFVIYACKSIRSNAETSPGHQPGILVFAKTARYHHASIAEGLLAIQKLGRENKFSVDTTTDAAFFVEDRLRKYAAVIFLSTTGDVLNADQQVAFERFIQAGGGFAGIHAATDTEYDWPWYNKLVGAYFLNHPKQQKAVVAVRDKNHPSTSFLPDRWERFDEWYNYKSIMPDIQVLATLDEKTYEGGKNGDNHPIAWYHEVDGGRAWYTGLGHTKESYTSDTLFLKHLLGGIQYAIGNNKLNYSKAYAVRAPDDNRFTKTILSDDLNEPMELTVAPDGRVFFTERAGKFYLYDPVRNKTRLLWAFPVKAVDNYLNGLIGTTLDPDFRENNYIYFFYTSSTGSQLHQKVSRFTLTKDNNLDTASEKVIIKIPIDAEVSAHTGGSLAWDKDKNLYISTGDNTVPFESDGYAPLDERPGRLVYDAQRSAGNSNDLRGKILRIHPEPDGSYTIPDGNLFPKGTEGTRQEIYVMGCRNPYRIAVDTATSILYWGEVGPDAGNDSRHGPRGYDEFNQAGKAGNFGWPYFVGDNKAYHDSDFAAKTAGAAFDVSGPQNNSRNNTGLKKLPPPQKAMIWYPYSRSTEFPDLGEGGRCAMSGPVYHYDPNLASDRKFPAYYDRALFVYDWMRNWIFAVRLDEDNHYKRMEPFMRTNGDFHRPIDIEFGPDGAMYMLEYGSIYGIDNVDARLVRIDCNSGNRAPVAKISTSDTIGLAPYKVALSSRNSYDDDENDKLTYQWIVNNEVISTEPNPIHTFQANGIYHVALNVSDIAGKSSTDTIEIKVGNTIPKVIFHVADNSTFFFDKPTAFRYTVEVQDQEDSVIDRENLRVTMKYLPRVASNVSLLGLSQVENYNYGRSLIAANDCKTCHQSMGRPTIPSFMQVSEKYWNNKNAIGILANKIITGGSGVWGQQVMSAHPQLSKDDATEIVKYVLSVAVQKPDMEIPQEGTEVLNEQITEGNGGRYIFTAAYTDKGGAITPLTGKDRVVLRPSKVEAEGADVIWNLQKGTKGLEQINNKSYFVLRNIDLKDIRKLTYRYSSKENGALLEVHAGSPDGQLISTAAFKTTGAWDNYEEAGAAITDPGGKHDLYFVFVKNETPDKNIASLDWIKFEGGNEVKLIERKPVVKTRLATLNIPKKGSSPFSNTPGASKKAAAGKNPGRILIAKNDCYGCHKVNQKLVGPAYADIAKRYKNQPAATKSLIDKILKGGAGNWGQAPMASHPLLSKNDAKEMVKYILSLKK